MGQAGAEQARYTIALAAWEGARDRHDAAEHAQLERTHLRYEVMRPEPTPRRATVYGGTPAGWQALLTTMGTSLLAGDHTLLILDLLEREAPARLLVAALEAGYLVDETVLPRDQERFDPLAGLSADEAVELLAEALRTQVGDAGRPTRNVDARVLSAARSRRRCRWPGSPRGCVSCWVRPRRRACSPTASGVG